ncbi:hypothetical protein F5X68DRAFT_258242 [Plectosphaerella plurivora]|uniref:Uncharacterized protein n=1 Tax=Plectosphaerella plurivora TaxID=936078 RepID=A0A9P9AFX1_9PEZI|nr:hypothetical protein F5X68DRAFT_258242 [Plectosphaerella plurivora]
MSVFVNYAGPKLDKKQNQVVRSQAMVSFRGRQKQARNREVIAQTLNTRRLAPIADRTIRQTDTSNEDAEDATRPGRPVHGRKCNSRSVAVVRSGVVANHPNPYDLRGAPPMSTHMTGVDARTFQDYLCRCGSYTSYLDEAFVLVGFRQPSYFRPDMSKAACIYIGWLLTAGVLDAVQGSKEIVYPYYEYQAVRELQKFIDQAEMRELHEVVYPVIVLGMFEMVRFSPRAVTHLAAVEQFVKSRGGLQKMPIVMQHLVVMGDLLLTVCMSTPLAFNSIGHAPVMRLATAGAILAGDQLLSCPFLLCDDEDFSVSIQHFDDSIAGQLADVLKTASNIFAQFFDINLSTHQPAFDLDNTADSVAGTNTAGILLETCALATRIMRRTFLENLDGFDHPANKLDLLKMYANTRFIRLEAWAGLPYIYVWVNLVGYATSPDENMRSYFIAEVVRCAFSYGCYQMIVFQGKYPGHPSVSVS